MPLTPSRRGAKAFVLGIASDKKNRQLDDFYPTPPEAVRALLDAVEFNGLIWEPACGDGAISKVLIERGYEVESTDLIDRGYGTPNRDFLLEWTKTIPNIITNPPFKHAEEFAVHALERATDKVAFLCRLGWLEGVGRRSLFTTTPLSRVLVFSNRLAINRDGKPLPPGSSGMIAFAWYVWEHGYKGKPMIDFLIADKIGRPSPSPSPSVIGDLFDRQDDPEPVLADTMFGE